jgi:hypothetical protein
VGDDASPILAAVARKKERKRERVQFERKLQSTPSEAEEEDLIAKLSPSTFSILATKSPKNLSSLMTTSLCKTTNITHFTTSVGEGERESGRERDTDTDTESHTHMYTLFERSYFSTMLANFVVSVFSHTTSSQQAADTPYNTRRVQALTML